jgi:hypothetical protein
VTGNVPDAGCSISPITEDNLKAELFDMTYSMGKQQIFIFLSY